MSLYAEYLRERTEDHIFEDDRGFVTWRYLNDRQVYIIDIYVKPEYRQKGKASSYAQYVIERAKWSGCTELLGTVVPSTKGSTTSLKVLLSFGMKLKESKDNLIILSKDI